MTAIAADPVEEAIERVLQSGCTARVRPGRPITSEYLAALQTGREGIWCESTAEGELIISGASDPPVSAGETRLSAQVVTWEVRSVPGTTRATTGGFNIEGWGFKIPDISWISREREAAALRDGKVVRGYLPAAPEFVIEVRSPGDDLRELREKMAGWTTHGVLLALLVDPRSRNVHLYRNGEAVDLLREPETVDCEPEMPGLILDFTSIWPLFND